MLLAIWFRKAIDLAGSDDHLILKCLNLAVNQPKLMLPESVIEEKVQIIRNIGKPYFLVFGTLGIYYLRHKKVNTKYYPHCIAATLVYCF